MAPAGSATAPAVDSTRPRSATLGRMFQGIAPLPPPDRPHAPAGMGRGVPRRHGPASPAALERHAFRRTAGAAFAIVRTPNRRFCGNLPLTGRAVPP